MFATPCDITSEPRSAVCVTCGLDVPIATVTTLLALDGVDFEEWDNADFTRPFRCLCNNITPDIFDISNYYPLPWLPLVTMVT